MVEKKEVAKKTITRFTKDKLAKSKKYSNRIDILNAVLEDKKEYSFEEADKQINDYMKGKVE